MGRRLDLLKSRILPARAPTSEEISANIRAKAPPATRGMLDFLGIDVGQSIEKEARTVVPEAITTYGYLQEPPYDPPTLAKIADMHWVVRTCRNKLVREAVRQGWEWDPLYEVMCSACKTQFDFSPVSDACPECDGELEKPNMQELVRAKKFIEQPNPQFTFDDILKRNASDLITFDDFYVSVASNATTLEVWPEDARTIRIVADEKGRLGGDTFCPVEEDTKDPGTPTHFFRIAEHPPGSPCPDNDGGVLERIAYGQTLGQDIVAAFKKEDVLHDNLFATGTRLYGTPLLWAVQQQLITMQMIDRYQGDAFEKAKSPKNIFIYKGFTDEDHQRIMKQYEVAKKYNDMADMHVPIPGAIGTAQGNIGIEVIRGIETPLVQGSIQFSEWYFKAICYTFGVDPASVGVETPGRLGSSQEGIANSGVSQESVGELQTQLAEAWNRFFVQHFQEIKSFRFRLKSAYEEEESKQLTARKLEMETAKLAVDAGFDVLIDEDGSVKISGKGKRVEPPSPFGGGGFGNDEEKPEEETTTSTAIAKSLSNVPKDDPAVKDERAEDLEKASRWQRDLIRAANEYKEHLDQVASFVAGKLLRDLDDVLAPGPVEPVTDDLRDTILSRSRKVLEMASEEAKPMLEEAAKELYASGKRMGLADIQKQDMGIAFDEADRAAIEAFYTRTQEAMRNTLYFGDKQTYLQKIRDIMQSCIEEGGCTTSILSRRLSRELDPEEEHFSDYMWERIARTETSAYVTAGRLKAYEEFDIPKVRRIVTLDERTHPITCAPFTNAVYKVEDSYDVIPAHPNCRCAFSPYFGPEEPLDSSQIIYTI